MIRGNATSHGEVAERFKAAVLKTAVSCKRAVGSNPTLSANSKHKATGVDFTTSGRFLVYP